MVKNHVLDVDQTLYIVDMKHVYNLFQDIIYNNHNWFY